ncbi:hypothetical protein HDU96_002625 [Phlyctochytrium bullatum]|nr:hypothetical protein HDU96_002625 [Phlyctochytrium bullatum]
MASLIPVAEKMPSRSISPPPPPGCKQPPIPVAQKKVYGSSSTPIAEKKPSPFPNRKIAVPRARKSPFLPKEPKDLWKACKVGDIEALRRFIAQDPSDVNRRKYWLPDEVEAAPLDVAAFYGHLEVARILLDSNAVPDGLYGGDYTTVHWAALRGHVKVVKLMLDRGDSVSPVGYHGSTPLHLAAGANHADVADVLLSRGADIEAKDDTGQTPLYRAATWGGANIEAPAMSGGTVLLAATSEGHLYADVVRWLIDSGANVNADIGDGSTVLHLVARISSKP